MDQPEHRLSAHVNMLLERIMVEPYWATAVETGTIMVNQSPQARMNAEAKRKKRGIKPAHLDWYAYQHPVYAQFELKVKGGRVSDNQDVTIKLLHERRIPAAVCWNICDVFNFLRSNNFRLHPNAANIAIEVSERWYAAQREADAKKGTPRNVGKPRAAKPTRAQVARGNAASLLGSR